MFVVNSCRNDGELAYNGDSLLLFNSPQSSANTTVVSGGGNTTYNVTFGVLKQAAADSDVTLVVDAANSTAKEGVDYTIANKTITLKNGTATGSFPIILLESGATLAGKSIAFKLQSNSLKNANFNQDFKLNISLACPFVNTKFTGNYKVVTDTWQDYNVGDLVPVTPGTAANQIFVRATNDPYVQNGASAYMILTVAADGTFTVVSNTNFVYSAANGGPLAVTGSGKVDRCSGDITINPLNYGNYKNYVFVLKKQ
ncbi:hypothetical protein [Halpernia sp. GG3]